MQIFYQELALAEGFAYSDRPKAERLIRGRQFSTCSGYELFSAMRDQRIKCWKCSCVADRWITTRGPNDARSYPVLNLFGTTDDGRLVMMTRDHIIPKAYGGVDDNENLRPGCEACNSGRGTHVTREDEEFMNANLHLISIKRLQSGIDSLKRVIARTQDVDRRSVYERLIKSELLLTRIQGN